MIMMTIEETTTWLQETDDCSICELFKFNFIGQLHYLLAWWFMKVGWWEGVIISVFKVFICLISRVLLTSERGPLYRYPSRLIYWCIYSELSIVGLLWKKGVLYLFVSYQGYYKKVSLIGHWLVLALMVRVRDF